VRPDAESPTQNARFDWKGILEMLYLGVHLMHFGETYGANRPGARCWLRPQIRFGYGRKRGPVRALLCSANIRAEIVSRLHVTGFANGIRQPIGRMSQKDAGLA
jgi:hypothetical protein